MIYICADIGESAPTEIIVMAQINEKYRYLYNITLYNLTDKQQRYIFKYLVEKLQANVISMDTTEGTGRAIYRGLNEMYPSDNMVWCNFAEKIDVDFEKDENGRFVYKDGHPVYKQEFVADWSIIRLKHLFYEEILVLPKDFKLEVQINNVVCMISGKRIVYQCLAEADHLISAFRVFAIAQWDSELRVIKAIRKKKFSRIGA